MKKKTATQFIFVASNTEKLQKGHQKSNSPYLVVEKSQEGKKEQILCPC